MFSGPKVDTSKAYDRVEWHYLRKVLVTLGFPIKWIDLLMVCVTSVTYSFFINGFPSGLPASGEGFTVGQPNPSISFYFVLRISLLSCLNGSLKEDYKGSIFVWGSYYQPPFICRR